MSHPQFPRRAIASLLTGLLLLVPTVISASAESEEVAPVMLSAASAASVLAYEPSPEHPLITRTNAGWEIDRGGPGTYFERFAEDGD